MAEKDKNPEIRFTGFTDVWEQRMLSDISDKVLEKNANRQYTETFTNSAEFGIISQRDFFDHDISNIENLDGYYVVKNEDFVYNPRISNFAPVGPINRNKLGRNGVMSPLYTVFRTHDIDNTFLEQYFKSRYWHSFMKLNGDTGARSDRFSIRDSVFIEMPIPYPDLKEQLKIGEFLTNIDNLITLYKRKYDNLVIVKKSMLQKMFPKDGDNSPEIRFTGFTDAWEHRKLGDVTFPSGVKNSDNISYESYSISNEKGFVPQNEQFEHGGTMKDADKSMYYIVSPQSFAYNPARINVGSIGYQNLSKSVIVSSLYEVFKTTNECDDVFLWYWIKTDYFQKIIERYQEGGVRLYFYYDNFCKGTIPLPSVEEQHKIGLYFTHLDNLITLHQRKLEKLKNIKKSMLEKMFV
ncbi:restriction endonuclease subunit S [Alkalihalobacterium alkalinitrilicum]|uniref:restriction endonuclease subunit S n=1 Tax=Alkalihalobacterium alkalinitrilicum TaxID=427920 RepID=UPI000994F2BC|nr:restriction endonuclease subunit S [Alkalihalobacterium alkalinitrilicum]